MKSPIRALLALLALVLSACAGSQRVVQLPKYGADLYPQAQTLGGITVAVDELTNAERVERLFGSDLIKEGILPVTVVVSNFGKQRLRLKPTDVLFYQGKDVIDPLPVEVVMAAAKRQKQVRTGTGETPDKNYGDALLKETAIDPNQTYRGIMFFAVPAPKPVLDRFFASLSLHPDDGPKMRIGMTNLESGERVLFAPFSVKLPESAGAFSY
jgi:hypothetical protein